MLKNFASVTADVTPLLPATVSDFRIDKYLNDFGEECWFIEGTNDGVANDATLMKIELNSVMLAAKVVIARWGYYERHGTISA